jgi:Cys-tRNA(Pro)/Cys-tRNA(Cys) deacylase
MEFRNNVTRLLDSRRVPYTVHAYDPAHQSAVEVAEAIGLPAERVFKTLVALAEDANRKPLLVIIPGPATLDLKRLAQAARLKKVRMATHDQAEALTGLQTGGISALALINRGFDVYLAGQALQYDTIAVSAGQRGVNLELPVKDLVKLTNARVFTLE